MAKFPVDVKKLEDKILKRAYKLSEVENKIEKIAFDIVRFKDNDDASNLWQIQSSDDGDYIVCLYEPELENKKSLSAWQVSLTKNASHLNISYKGESLVKVAINKLGLSTEDLPSIERYLPKKLSENKNLVKSLLKELSEPAKNQVLNKYPELL